MDTPSAYTLICSSILINKSIEKISFKSHKNSDEVIDIYLVDFMIQRETEEKVSEYIIDFFL